MDDWNEAWRGQEKINAGGAECLCAKDARMEDWKGRKVRFENPAMHGEWQEPEESDLQDKYLSPGSVAQQVLQSKHKPCLMQGPQCPEMYQLQEGRVTTYSA